jgi:hypothetical protein
MRGESIRICPGLLSIRPNDLDSRLEECVECV